MNIFKDIVGDISTMSQLAENPLSEYEHLQGLSRDELKIYTKRLLLEHYRKPADLFYDYRGMPYTIDLYKYLVKEFVSDIDIFVLQSILENTYTFNKYADRYFKILIDFNVDIGLEEQYTFKRTIRFGNDTVCRVFLTSPFIQPTEEDLDTIERHIQTKRNYSSIEERQKYINIRTYLIIRLRFKQIFEDLQEDRLKLAKKLDLALRLTLFRDIMTVEQKKYLDLFLGTYYSENTRLKDKRMVANVIIPFLG